MNLQLALIIFIFGLCAGSFLNVVIHRLPKNASIVSPSSRCPVCENKIRFYDNIPLLSYIVLRGKCRHCGARISFRYFVVELLTGLLALAVFLRFGLTSTGLIYFMFCAILVAVTFIDLDTMTIPDSLTIPGIPAGLLASSFITGVGTVSSILGIIVGGGVLLIIAEAFWRLRKKEGMGGGDIKLLAMIGAFLGLLGVVVTLVISSLVGAVVGLGVVAASRSEDPARIPFGPFLAIGALCHIFWGRSLIIWYLSLFAR